VLTDLRADFTVGNFSRTRLKLNNTFVVGMTEQKRYEEITPDQNGKFQIALPAGTTMFKIAGTVHTHVGCTQQRLNTSFCYPAEMSSLLVQSNLQLRLMVDDCNQFTIDASGWDHANAKEQLGPVKAARAMAMVHMGMFEALNAVENRCKSYFDTKFTVNQPISSLCAIAQAECKLLYHLFPAQASQITTHQNQMHSLVSDGLAKTNGIALGDQVAQAIIDLRTNDGSNVTETSYDDYIAAEYPNGSVPPGAWTKDPVSNIGVALGYKWKNVKPFVIDSASQFRCPVPPSLTSVEYTNAFNEAKALGGDGVTTKTSRSAELTNVGLYWAYDGTPTLCAPPRLYNQIAKVIAMQESLDYFQTLRLYAILNITMADAGLTSWESKYYYKLWRPVTGIRETHFGGVPADDGNPATVVDLTFKPLGAPATNSNGLYFTPPFPAYPSGHATFGGALFQVLRNILGRDDIAFTFVSDELNGVTEYDGTTRPFAPRSFTSLSQAEEENGQSRIYLGIHWYFDKTAGIKMGNEVANYISSRLYHLSSP